MNEPVISAALRLIGQLLERKDSVLIAIDGRSEKLTEATTLTIRKAPFTINIVKRNGRRYFASLREKMMWGVDGRK